MPASDDYYGVLGVPRGAGRPEIRRAYRRLAPRHHPDRNPGRDAAGRFHALAEAYAVLNHPARRARYDATVRAAAESEATRPVPAVVTHRGVLELSPREAQLAAATSLRLTTTHGLTIVLPAGAADGDEVTFRAPGGRVALTVRVARARKT